MRFGGCSARLVGALGIGAALYSASCGLFKAPGKTPDTMKSAGIHDAKLKLRYSLLAPFPQVANAARAELKALGATERESLGGDGVRFVIRDEQEAGEDHVTLEPEGTILVFSFSVHHSPKQQGQTENPGAEVERSARGSAKKPTNPGEEVRQHAGGEQGGQAESDAAKTRRTRIARLILCLPGVGDLVDRDGMPKEHQFVSREACRRGDGVTDAADAGASASATATLAVTDGGLVTDAATDAGKDAGLPRKTKR